MFFCIKFLWAISCIFYQNNCFAEIQKRAYVTVLENTVVDYIVLRDLLPDTFFLSKVQIESDIQIDTEEICYLMNIQERTIVTTQELISGIEQCAKKDRILSLHIYKEIDHGNVILFVRVVGKYLLKQTKIVGIWHDIDLYKRLYKYQKFEPFEEKRHREGISAIEDYLHSIGYCAATVHDEIVYDHLQKYVTIILRINPREKFKISAVQLCFDELSKEHEITIKELFSVCCVSKLLHYNYTHEKLNMILVLFMEQLRLAGFLCSKVITDEYVTMSENTVLLNILLKGTYQNRIFFEGNEFFSSKQLFDHINTIFKNEHGITSDVIREELLSLYKSYGFFHVSITQEVYNYQIHFKIDEAHQSTVSNVFFSWSTISDCNKTKYQELVSQQLVRRPAQAEMIFDTLERCVQELIKDGFLQAKLVGYRYEEEEDKGSVVVHVSIDSGKQVYIDDIVLKFDQKIIEISTDFFKIKNQTLLDVGMLSKQREQILFLLHDAGYLHVVVFPEIVYQENKAILVWHVIPGKQVYFGKLIILGHPVMPFSKTLKNIMFQTDDLWQQHLIQQSLENLQKLSLYEHIELYPELYGTREKKEFFLRLVPDDPFEVRLRAGMELQYIQDYQTFGGITYKLGASFIAKNRFKCADILQLDADFAGGHREIIFAYNLPLILPKYIYSPLSQLWNLKIQWYHMRYDQPGVIGYPKNLYMVGRDGLLCAVCAKKDNSYINFSCGFEAQKTTIKNRAYAQIIADLINFDQQLLGKEIPFLFFETDWLLDLLNDKLYPTRGTSSLLSFKAMIPFQDVKRYFAKILYEQAFFVSLYVCVLGLRFRLGYLFHKEFSKISPMERFYLGGSHSVRGYEADLFPPTSPLIDDSEKIVLIPRGGKIMANINIELRKTIISYVSIALFHDMGTLADNFEMIYTRVPLQSSGFGLRFDTPFGPLRFDIGWKWTLTYKDERRYAWYLSFGRSF